MAKARLKIAVRGAVQGVGFRPFVHRLATELCLAGWVRNSSEGVFIEVEGARADLDEFLGRLQTDRPPRSFIQSLESRWLDPIGASTFEILPSETGGGKTAIILPDIATCPDCLREIFDPTDRRYRYPFTNCTNCGPRLSIIESLPYDRANTSMKSFAICPDCNREYHDPANRRFHAEPIACPICGPQLELWDAAGKVHAKHHDALLRAAEAIRAGQILALKGVGGFQLLVDARDEAAVRRLRERKHREEKPFAVMVPSLEKARRLGRVAQAEERLLSSPEAPIVLLARATVDQSLAPAVAPNNPNLGIMLPYSPLHHLLMAELGFPVVATSGNLSDEPICIEEQEARERLGAIADVFLIHNRPIVRHVDDSVARVILGRPQVLRRARGYAPLPLTLADGRPAKISEPPNAILATGAHLKNTIALSIGPQIFVSQHIGDLETAQSYEAFTRVVRDFQRLYDANPSSVASDGHPDYLSTRFAKSFVAEQSGRQIVTVQHHKAHVLACAAENELIPPVLGVSWDGTGDGMDGTVWGGEFFLLTANDCRRVAHLRQFRLPGGDQAVKEPRRSALGLLYEMLSETQLLSSGPAPVKSFSAGELRTLSGMLKHAVNSPLTSSAGRLFDAVSALMGLRQVARFEGQAAMELEFATNGITTDDCYHFGLTDTNEPGGKPMLVLDWAPVITDILEDLERSVAVGLISAKFHNALAEAVVTIAQRLQQTQVVLSGGCFQNRYLTERTVAQLERHGFRPYWHQIIPPNDGGISVGQIVATCVGLR